MKTIDPAARQVEATRRLEAVTAQLKAALGEDLHSVVLYGSAARGDWSNSGSDLNLLLVLRELTLPALEKVSGLNKEWTARGNRPFLFFSPWWIEHSRDVFPLEFLDILDSRRVLHGADPFAGLTVSLGDLRLQCERELKSSLIHLRTAYMEHHDRAARLAELLAASYSPLAALCRGILRLAGEAPPAESGSAIERVAALCGLDPAPLKEVEALKRSGPGGTSTAPRILYQHYYTQMETLARALDAGQIGRINR